MARRKFSILCPTKQRTKIKKIYGFDIETYDRNRKFLLASIVGESTAKVFFNKDTLINEFKKRKYKDSIIVASNLSFDFFGVLFNRSEMKGFNTLFRGSNLLSAVSYIYDDKFNRKRDKNRGNRIQFLDTFNYCPFSVKKLGKIIGLDKLPTPSFIGDYPKGQKQWNEMIRYNIRDSDISRRFLIFLYQGLIDLGATPKMTVASSSMSLFRNVYLKDTYFRHNIPDLLFQFRSYYGGRTEAFKRGMIKNYHYYDVNSLYPTVMQKDFPDPNTLRKSYKNTINYINEYMGCSDVDLYLPKTRYPCLPFRDNDKVIFPFGEMSGVWTHEELKTAISKGAIIKRVRCSYYFTKTCSPFKNYVTDIYNKRLEYKKLKSPMELITKLMLNSLYGKFSQRFFDRDNLIPFDHTVKDLQEMDRKGIKWEVVGDFLRVNETMGEPAVFCIPIWASYVTSYARLLLLDLLEKTQAIYCDTDSIITRTPMPESTKLGDLKEEMFIEKGYIIRPKFYAVKDKENSEYVKIKGFALRLMFNEFENLVKNPDENLIISAGYDKFLKVKEAIRRGLTPNEITRIEKHLSLSDDKRNWLGRTFTTDGEFDSDPHQLINGTRPKAL